jgi:chemotaxis signal transduction protein
MSFEHLSAPERALLQLRAQRLNQTESVGANPTLEVVMLTIGTGRYAFELHDLRAVLRSKVTRLPGLNRLIAGVINVQGELVSVLELPLLLGLTMPNVLEECVLLVSTQHGKLGLRVPNLPELETIDATNTVSMSERLGLNDGKIMLLKVENLLRHAEKALSLE